MKIYQALLKGMRRSLRTLPYVLGVYLLNLFVAGVLGVWMAGILGESLGHSMAAEHMRLGFDGLWYQSFSSTAQGLGRLFTPAVVGIGAVFEGLDKFLSGTLFDLPPILMWFAGAYVLLWILVTPGFISKLQGKEARGFLASAGQFFFRFLLLFLLSAILYYLTFRFVALGLKGWIEEASRQMTDERKVFSMVVLAYFLTWTILFLINLIFDYSKIITVTHNIRWAIAAPFRAIGFILSHPLQTLGLYLLLTGVWVAAFLIYWLIVPGAGQGSWGAVWLTFVVGQLYVLFRIFLRVGYYGSQLTLYEGLSRAEQAPAE